MTPPSQGILPEPVPFRVRSRDDTFTGYEQLLLDGHICGARTRDSYRCRKSPVKGKRRCRLHGGASTGPKTVEGRENSLGALVTGHQQWYERKKARGYPFRGGWRKGMPRHPDRRIAKERVIAATLALSEFTKQRGDGSLADRFAEATALGLVRLQQFLDLSEGRNDLLFAQARLGLRLMNLRQMVGD